MTPYKINKRYSSKNLPPVGSSVLISPIVHITSN